MSPVSDQNFSPRWLVSTAVGDPKLFDGSPLMYHDAETREPTRPVREDEGRCAIVEAETPQEAARKAVEWLAAEFPGEMRCDNCERPHPGCRGVVVLPYENPIHFEADTLWRVSDEEISQSLKRADRDRAEGRAQRLDEFRDRLDYDDGAA